jgi:hypothetical protein
MKAPRSNNAPTPTARKASLAVPAVLRDSSRAGSSPSPATRHQLSQVRRASVAHKNPSPLRPPTSNPVSVSHASQKNLSIVPQHDDEPSEDNFNNFRPRVNSLAPVPGHPEWSDTSDSTFKRDIVSSTSPEVVARVQFPLFQPAPARTVFERIADRRPSNAIEVLEQMVQEAVEIADDAKDRRQVEDIYEIIEDARAAIQDAAAHPTRHLMATTSPLKASDSSKETGTVPLELPRVHAEQRDSAAFDWAYPRHTKQPDTSSSSISSSDKADRGHSNFSTQSDLLLPPQPIQTASRDHVDFVLRPIAHDHSRGRPRHRVREESARSIHRHRHRHRHRSTSISRRRQHISSGFSQYDTSCDEEDPSTNPYGNELSIREQAHHHTFSLHRHHHRQPIARNWTTGKKRLTAAIACINTALLGIIVGIYVSSPSSSRCNILTRAGR